MNGESRSNEKLAAIDSGVAEHFRTFAEEYDDSTEWCSDPALLAPLVDGVGEGELLDLGCGTGLLAEAVEGTSRKIWGLDLSYSMLVKAYSRMGARVIQAKAEALPLRSEGLGLVVCRQVLHYTREAEVLCEVARVLRPGGEFRLAQITSHDERDFLFWAVFKAISQPIRRRYYTPDLLRTIVESCGFLVKATRQYQIRRHYTSEDLFRRSPLPEGERDRFIAWMTRRLDELAEVLEPEWRDGSLSITQSWSLLSCVKRG